MKILWKRGEIGKQEPDQNPGSLPQGGARGQNLGHLEKIFFYYLSVMKTTWSGISPPCNTDL